MLCKAMKICVFDKSRVEDTKPITEIVNTDERISAAHGNLHSSPADINVAPNSVTELFSTTSTDTVSPHLGSMIIWILARFCIMEKLTLWCMDNEAVDKARKKDPKIGLIPCKGPECPRYEGGLCILIWRVGKYGLEFTH